MRILGIILGIVGALLIHAAILLFGGIIFLGHGDGAGTTREVELLGDTEADPEKEQPKEEEPSEETEEVPPEEVPDASEVIRNLETPQVDAIDNTPRLEDASLSAIEQALSGKGGSGEFGDALSFTSGGRIGGTGTGALGDEKVEEAFSLSEIDQGPRAVHQVPVAYPPELRSRKLEGSVVVLLFVDQTGKVTKATIEQSSNPAFDKPALNAVKQWKFEPGMRGGERVASKIRVPLRIQP